MFKEEDRAGIGVIIRDSQGLVLASMSQVIPLPLTVMELKTLATVKALEMIINSLNDNSPSLSPFGLLLQDVENYANLFQCISFLHIR